MTYIPSIHTISDARESIQYCPNRFPSPSNPFGIGIPSTAKKTRTSRFTNNKKNETAILHRVLLAALLCLLGWGEVWGNSSSFSGSSLSAFKTGLIGTHATFYIDGGSYSSSEWVLCSLKNNNEQTFHLTWVPNTGTTIKVTKVTLKMLGYGSGSQVKAKINGGSYINIGSVVNSNTNVVASDANGLSSGMELTVTCTASIARDIRITSATFEYTITPNAPTLSTQSKTITVTETLDVADCFSVPDTDFEKAYECTSSGGTLNGTTFSANKAGTYYVVSYITAKDNCHAASGTSTALAITVNRIAGNITANNASTYVNDNFDLSQCITSSLGTGAISYQVTSDNAADATITAGVFKAQKAGTYTIQATKAQDDQHNEASTTFTITVSKKEQTLTFTSSTYDPNIVKGTTVTGAAAATASSGLPVTYSSSNDGVASVDGNGNVTGESLSNDPITITATQAGNDEYNPASITREFYVISKKVTGFTPSAQLSTIYVGDQPTITVKDEGEGFTYSSSEPDVVGISKSGDVITLTALKVGTSTISLEQPETTTHSAVTQTYNITVEKVANTLELGLSSQSAQVDGSITVYMGKQNNTETPIVATITDQYLPSPVNNGEDVIIYEDGVIKARNAGTAKITFTQA